jgi:integrase
MVRFDPATAKHLDRYLRARARHPRYARRRDLSIGFRGPLTRKGVPAILDKRTAMAGIGHIHAHQLRHTWSHRWLANGGAEQDLMRLGGWSSHEIMARYCSAQGVDRALAAYDNVDPMGEL